MKAAHTSHSSLLVGGTDLDVVGECPEEGLRETGEEVVVRDEVEREQSSSVGLGIEMNASDVVEADGQCGERGFGGRPCIGRYPPVRP